MLPLHISSVRFKVPCNPKAAAIGVRSIPFTLSHVFDVLILRLMCPSIPNHSQKSNGSASVPTCIYDFYANLPTNDKCQDFVGHISAFMLYYNELMPLNLLHVYLMERKAVLVHRREMGRTLKYGTEKESADHIAY